MYFYGHGVAQDYATAMHWYRSSAQAGSVVAEPAEARLGDMYYEGTGVSRDYSAALHWYRLAAGPLPASATLFRDLYHITGPARARAQYRIALITRAHGQP